MTDAGHDTHEREIRARAHELWMAEGQPEGRADQHWHLAEEAIRLEYANRGAAKLEDADPLPPK